MEGWRKEGFTEGRSKVGRIGGEAIGMGWSGKYVGEKDIRKSKRPSG